MGRTHSPYPAESLLPHLQILPALPPTPTGNGLDRRSYTFAQAQYEARSETVTLYACETDVDP